MKIKKVTGFLGFALVSIATLFIFSPTQTIEASSSGGYVVEEENHINIFFEGDIEKESYHETIDEDGLITTVWKHEGYTEEQLLEKVKEQLVEEIGYKEVFMYDWRTVPTGRTSVRNTGWRRAGGQDVGGHAFNNATGAFNFLFSGGPSVTLNFGVSWKGVGLTVDVGRRVNDFTGLSQNITPAQVNRFVHLELWQEFTASEVRIERRNRQNPTGPWILDRMATATQRTGTQSRTVLAR